ncbi:MAG: hypothetical protein P4M11_03300 [Candidatus Pacebacteria bacterium]|nr:hypothetical protein [Candidatus Paceibacterota bacterium]
MFFNEMSGDLLNDRGEIQDCEADIMSTLLALEHAKCRVEMGSGEKLDQLMEKELNIRVYNQCVALAQLQAKQHSLALMRERLDALTQEYVKQDAKFMEFKMLHDKYTAKSDLDDQGGAS